MKKILSFFAVMLFAFAVNAATTVSPTAEKNNLSAAVAAATAGDVLELTNDTFNEDGNFAIDKDLTIKAAEGAKPIIKNLYYFRVEAGAKVTFQGIEFDGSGASDHCIRSHNGSNGSEEVTLDNCSFHNYPSYVLYTQRNSRKWHSLTIKNCYFYDNVKYAVAIIYESSTATTCDAVSVENSTFANTTGSYAAIFIQDGNATELSVDHCTFYNFGAQFIKAEASATNIAIANSIFAQPAAKDVAPVLCSAGTVKNCLAFNTADYAEGPTVTGGINADPKFEDAANGSFYLAEDSPARNAGTDSKTLGDPRWWEKPKLTAPDAAPAAPELNKKQVKAVYSATYNADCGFGEWGSGTVYTQEEFGKKFVTTNLGYFGLLFEGDNALNCTKMEKLHLDIWVAADTALRVVPIWKAGGAEKGVWATLKGQQWNAIDIALTEYDNVTDWSNIYQIKLDEIREQTFWVNNVYFYTTVVPPVDNDAPTEVTAVAGDAAFFSADIKAKATDASGSVIFTVKNGDAVVATKGAESGVEAIITVKNLKPSTEYNLSVIASDEDENAAEPVAVTVKTAEGPAAAPAPEFDAAKVLSIYSDAYTFAPASLNSYNEGWWEAPVMAEGELAEGDKALYYAAKETGMIGWQFGEIDATNFPFLHLDIYPMADGTIEIYPVNNTDPKGEYRKTVTVKGGQWNHVIIDLRGKDLTKIYQIGWINYYLLNGFFIDNVFFASKKIAKAQPNIFAYGIKGAFNAEANTLEVEYSLNANANSVEVEFFNADGEIEMQAILDKADQLTPGAHKATIEYMDILDPGTYTWAIHAYADATDFENLLPIGDPRYSFYLPQDVVVDNSFESEYFGNIYVSMPWEGESDGMTATTQQQHRGLFYFDPSLETVNGKDSALVGFDGGLGGATNTRNGIKRLSVDEQGFVYVASRDPETKGVYRADPSDMSKPFATVLAANYTVDALEVVGDKLYTIEDIGGTTGGQLNTYKLDQIPVGAATKTWELGDKNLANADETLRSDRRGGFWIAQNRYGLDVYPGLTHLNSKGQRDFWIDQDNNADLLSNTNGNLTYRGTMGVSVDGKLLAISSNKEAVVFAVEWNDEGVPSLSKVCETPVIGGNIDGIAFDIADNLFVACASMEQFRMYPLAKADGENNCRVYAASKYNIVIKEEEGVDNVSATVAPVKVLRDGQVLIIRNGVEYNVLGAQLK